MRTHDLLSSFGGQLIEPLFRLIYDFRNWTNNRLFGQIVAKNRD
jgi:hypothetical protein